MKKIISAILASICIFMLCSCQKQNAYEQKISQMRYDVLAGESQSYNVKAYIEKREYPYKADGIVREMRNYVIFKLNFKSAENGLTGDLSVTFKTDKDYTASVIFKPEQDSYIATVEVNALPNAPLTATITLSDKQENVTLTSICSDIISPEKALASAAAAKQELLKDLEEKNTSYEIMVRVINQDNSKYYYIGIVETDYTTALLISDTGKVLAEKRIRNQ